MLICIFHWLRFYNYNHTYTEGSMYFVCCSFQSGNLNVTDVRGHVTYRLET
jgi:hypothetical protein